MLSNRSGFTTELKRVLTENPGMRAIIERNQGSRLFDGLPDAFDEVFADTNSDANQLGEMLKQIRSRNIEMTDDRGPVFTKEVDKTAIRNWAKRIMARICDELLTNDNEIIADFLPLIGKTSKTLSNRDLICAYFSIANQYMIKKMMVSDAARSIMVDVFNAFMTYINHYPSWVKDVLKDRTLSVKPSYLDRSSAVPLEDANFDLHFGVGAAALGLVGLFALGGFAAYEAYQARHRHTSDDEADHPQYPDRQYNN